MQKTCAICLNIVIPGQGHAIFTAECSHSFHFNCITSNVKHGNLICPICRAKWKEIPFQGQTPEVFHGKLRANSVNWNRDNPLKAALQQLPLPQPEFNQNISLTYCVAEPVIFNDDDLIEEQQTCREQSAPDAFDDSIKRVEIRAYPEVSAVTKSASYDNFTILIHLKAPIAKINNFGPNLPSASFSSRAPIDLVTVLDVSGSCVRCIKYKKVSGYSIDPLRKSGIRNPGYPEFSGLDME